MDSLKKTTFVMVLPQSFLHLGTSITCTADAPYFVNGSAIWLALSAHCTSILHNFTVSWNIAIFTLSLRSNITFKLLIKCSSSEKHCCFNLKISFLIRVTKSPASADSARAIVSYVVGLLLTLSKFFDFHVIGTALLLPHKNTR